MGIFTQNEMIVLHLVVRRLNAPINVLSCVYRVYKRFKRFYINPNLYIFNVIEHFMKREVTMNKKIIYKKYQQGIVLHTLEILKQNFSVLAVSFFVSMLFFTFFYGFWSIPLLNIGISRMSSVTATDYLFIFFASVLFGGIVSLIAYERKDRIKTGAASGVGVVGGAVAGFFGAVCPVCQGIVILAFGATYGIPTYFITSYTGTFKIISLVLLGMAFALKAQSIYTSNCVACGIREKKNGK